MPQFPTCKMDTVITTSVCPVYLMCELSVGSDDPNLCSHSRGCVWIPSSLALTLGRVCAS